MADIYPLLILFGVGIAAGFINVMAGGGSTLTLPTLIFLGLDAAVANGTNRIAIFTQNLSAVKSFDSEKQSEFKTSLKLSAFTLPGAIIGALLSVRIGDELFQTILGIVMIGIIISMVIPRKKLAKTDVKDKTGWPAYLAMTGIGFYGGFIQVGVGFILMSSLYYLLQINLLRVNVHKVFIILFYTIPALIIFIWTGNVNWTYGLSLAAGMAIGAWWSAKLSVKKGEKLIRWILIIAVFIMSLKMLGVF